MLILPAIVWMVLLPHLSQSANSASLGPAVLQHLATAKQAQSRRSHTAPQLSKYITLLPAPPQPPEWLHLCQQLEARGTAALRDEVQQGQCLLPDIQGSTAASCQLGRRPWVYQFSKPLLAAYAAALFHSIVAGRAAAAKQLGAPAPQLSRWDLWHGHFFVADGDGSSTPQLKATAGSAAESLKAQQQQQQQMRQPQWMPQQPTAVNASSSGADGTRQHSPRVGILFHAAEYPRYDPNFPVFLGHCQHNSTCTYNARAMDVRNILLYQGNLAVLDVGVDSPLHALLHEGTEPLRTVYEESFGRPVGDLLLLREPQRRRRRSLKASLVLEQQRWHRLLAAGHSAAAACSPDGLGVYVSF